jgi:hypothetical protein
VGLADRPVTIADAAPARIFDAALRYRR